ncbi:group II intron reverse transcriptase [Bacillus cereus]
MNNSSCVLNKISHLSEIVKKNSDRRLKDLYKLIRNESVLLYAYHKIRDNAGSKTAGVDKVTRDKLEANEHELLIKTVEEIINELKNQKFKPMPVRRVEIPKGIGKTGTRPLGIPILKDRIVQSAIKMVLEAIYEPSFKETSHGFRPKRSCQTAVNDIVVRKYDWVIEGDIKGCFDNIKHGILLNILRKKIADEKFIELINVFLKSGYQMGYGTDGKLPIFKTESGTPQGGIVSPVLANIYLNEFDEYMEKMRRNLPERIKISKEANHIKNKIKSISKALKEGKQTFRISIKEDVKKVTKTLKSKEQIEKLIEKITNTRSQYDSKSQEYKNLKALIHKLKKAIKEDKIPYKVSFNPEGKSTVGQFKELKNRYEMQQTLKEYKNQLKHISQFDEEEYWNSKSFGYVRYADDFVILLGNYKKEETIQLKEQVANWFEVNLGLTLSQEKTKITHATKDIRFLGYDIRKTPRGEGKLGYEQYSKVTIPQDKIKSVKSKIELIIRTQHNAELGDTIIALNRVINGWSNYFKIANNWSYTAGRLDYWTWEQIMRQLAWKHKSTVGKMAVKHSRNVQAYGVNKKRIHTRVGEKLFALKHFNDFNYQTPKSVSDKIKGSNETEKWHSTDMDEQEIQQEMARMSRGSSVIQRAELENRDGNKCSKCGKQAKELEVHHTKMVKRSKRKDNQAIRQASKDLPKQLLCIDCHNAVHPNNKITIR